MDYQRKEKIPEAQKQPEITKSCHTRRNKTYVTEVFSEALTDTSRPQNITLIWPRAKK